METRDFDFIVKFLLLLLIATGLNAEPKILRRVVYGLSCALSGYDAWQTNKYVNNGTYIEKGRLGSGNLFFSVKAGLCAAPIIVGETSKSNLVKYLTLEFSTTNTAINAITVVHNERTIR